MACECGETCCGCHKGYKQIFPDKPEPVCVKCEKPAPTHWQSCDPKSYNWNGFGHVAYYGHCWLCGKVMK